MRPAERSVPFHPCSLAGGGILRSLARRRRVPSSITTYRWPVTRTSPAGLGWPRPTKGGLGHRPGGSAVAAEREQRDVVLALLGQRFDDLVGEPLDVSAAAAGERREAVEPVVEAARARLDQPVGVQHERAARLERELVLAARRVRAGAERRAA